MIFLSAQPDDSYFIWQLEVQIHNFLRVGIRSDQIHILIGYNSEQGLKKQFSEFIQQNKEKARFYPYPDLRKQKSYPPSIRPNVIKQHIAAYPYLKDEVIFYHDSDIIFREVPDVNLLSIGDEWYVSDTRSYLDSSYLSKFGENIFEKMLSIVGIDKSVVESNDVNAGGAQYVIKKTSYSFWDKVENDSEALFACMLAANADLWSRKMDTIQAWCADMWSVLWNGLLFGEDIRIHRELEFCWPSNAIELWKTTKIFHNSGVTKEQSDSMFCKGLFTKRTPIYMDFSYLLGNNCSRYYVQEIMDYAKSIPRYDLSDVTFILPVRIDSLDRKENLNILLRYINKNFNTNILIVEADDCPKIANKYSGEGVQYKFVEDLSPYFHKTRYINEVINKVTTPIVALHNIDAIASLNGIRNAVDAIRSGDYNFAFPHNNTILNIQRNKLDEAAIDLDFISMFNDSHLHNSLTLRYFDGCMFLKCEPYKSCGGENISVLDNALVGLERSKRLLIKGNDIYTYNLHILHLNHYKTNMNRGTFQIRQLKNKKEIIPYLLSI